MTTLETILIAIIWIGYAIFAYYQTDDKITEDSNTIPLHIVYIIFSPIIFIGKCLYGAFKKYK